MANHMFIKKKKKRVYLGHNLLRSKEIEHANSTPYDVSHIQSYIHPSIET